MQGAKRIRKIYFLVEKKQYDDIKWGVKEEINVPTHRGSPRPDIKKWEPPVSPPVEIPQLEG